MVVATGTEDFLSRGVLASLTGGLFFDPHLSLFINTVHLYYWLLLFILPLALSLSDISASSYTILYPTFIGALFLTVKVVNIYLHSTLYASNETDEGDISAIAELTDDIMDNHQSINTTEVVVAALSEPTLHEGTSEVVSSAHSISMVRLDSNYSNTRNCERSKGVDNVLDVNVSVDSFFSVISTDACGGKGETSKENIGSSAIDKSVVSLEVTLEESNNACSNSLPTIGAAYPVVNSEVDGGDYRNKRSLAPESNPATEDIIDGPEENSINMNYTAPTNESCEHEMVSESCSNVTTAQTTYCAVTDTRDGFVDGSLSQSADVVHSSTRHQNSSVASPDSIPSSTHMKLLGSYEVSFNRLDLLHLMDRNKATVEVVASITLAIGVAYLGKRIDIFYTGMFPIFLWLAVAGSQYSLFKSVQPDAASPGLGKAKHGSVYTRSVLFIMSALLILLLDKQSRLPRTCSIHLYGIAICSPTALIIGRDVFLIFIVISPILFLIGVIPHMDTLTVLIAEQLHIHIFGGTAVAGPLSAAFSILKSVIASGVLAIIGYHAFSSAFPTGNALFYVYSGLLVAMSYLLSRQPSSPQSLLSIIRTGMMSEPPSESEQTTSNMTEQSQYTDHLEWQLISSRLFSDIFTAVVLFLVFTCLQATTVLSFFSVQIILFSVVGTLGILIHYFLPQFRKLHPWVWLKEPIIRSYEYGKMEVFKPAQITFAEVLLVRLRFVERHFLYPALFLSALSRDTGHLTILLGPGAAAIIITVATMKGIRSAMSDGNRFYAVVIITALFFEVDVDKSEGFLLNFAIMSIVLCKVHEFILKIRFALVYLAPWNMAWGSALHALVHPLSLPHTAILFLQAMLSTLLCAPLIPFLGSSLFFPGYGRPIKFWARDYSTIRRDQSNVRLANSAAAGSDANNMDAIFYEHLLRSLRRSLCTDLNFGRWGHVESGDHFLMTSDKLNTLVHIIEVGNGFVTFQLRGLEFKGTYCQQRELAALDHDLSADMGFERFGHCCPNNRQSVLSTRAALVGRSQTWEVINNQYVLQSYSIVEIQAAMLFMSHTMRSALLDFYLKSIIFYVFRASNLVSWLEHPDIAVRLNSMKSSECGWESINTTRQIDPDIDRSHGAPTLRRFFRVYRQWLQICSSRRYYSNVQSPCENQTCSVVSSMDPVVKFCFLLSLLARRLLSPIPGLYLEENFLVGFNLCFKGDFRITFEVDEWVFSDISILDTVLRPAVRMALKLHQEHFAFQTEIDYLYESMEIHEKGLVICHESSPEWRKNIFADRPELLTLRCTSAEADDSSSYSLVIPSLRHLIFRIIKLNRESVRGLWAGQQQELVFLRNRNPERGSIQQMKSVLRNIINQSCDMPIGYPIFVSPISTSYSDSKAFTLLKTFKSYISKLFRSQAVTSAVNPPATSTPSATGSFFSVEEPTDQREMERTTDSVTLSSENDNDDDVNEERSYIDRPLPSHHNSWSSTNPGDGADNNGYILSFLQSISDRYRVARSLTAHDDCTIDIPLSSDSHLRNLVSQLCIPIAPPESVSSENPVDNRESMDIMNYLVAESWGANDAESIDSVATRTDDNSNNDLKELQEVPIVSAILRTTDTSTFSINSSTTNIENIDSFPVDVCDDESDVFPSLDTLTNTDL